MKIIFVILIFHLCLACTSLKSPPPPSPNSTLAEKEIVIFVPGYKGTKLLDKDSKEVVWLSFKEVLLGEHKLDYNDSADQLISGSTLDHISIVPSICEIDIYGECLAQLKESFPKKVILEFNYDWRQSNIKTAFQLNSFLSQIKRMHPKSISIIAHSMGGLSVAFLASLNKLAEVEKIVFLGVPFRGLLAAFLDMNREAEPILFNSHLLSRAAFISFESAYELLPHPDIKIFSDEFDNTPSLYNTSAWQDYKWGPYLTTIEAESDLKNFITKKLSKDLERAQFMFKTFDLEQNYCPQRILNLKGVDSNTENQVSFSELKKTPIKDNKNLTLKYISGDELVTAQSSSLPKALSKCDSKTVDVPKLDHNKICNDQRAFSSLLEFLK